jgi:UTP-glucose-1-phosphate uridylyltransferase
MPARWHRLQDRIYTYKIKEWIIPPMHNKNVSDLQINMQYWLQIKIFHHLVSYSLNVASYLHNISVTIPFSARLK